MTLLVVLMNGFLSLYQICIDPTLNFAIVLLRHILKMTLVLLLLLEVGLGVVKKQIDLLQNILIQHRCRFLILVVLPLEELDLRLEQLGCLLKVLLKPLDLLILEHVVLSSDVGQPLRPVFFMDVRH